MYASMIATQILAKVVSYDNEVEIYKTRTFKILIKLLTMQVMKFVSIVRNCREHQPWSTH